MSRESYDNADRERRDDAGVGPYPEHGGNLVPLKELDHWDVAEGEPDIRGWQVRTLGGRVIGDVADLLIDTEEREVVMLDIDIEGSNRRTLAPIRAAQIDRAERIVLIDSADLHEEALPTVERAADRQNETDREVRADERRALAADVAPEHRTVRYRGSEHVGEGEQVIERRPVVVEEVVVRRRVVDDKEHPRRDEEPRP
jgi:PRC-barrel domain protein